MNFSASSTLREAANLFFPSDIYCAACGNLVDRTRPYALCDRCIREISWHTDGVRTCRVCGKSLAPHRAGSVCGDCRAMGRSFDAGISCCDYSGRASDMVRAMKYRESSWIAGGIAEAMRDRWEQLRGASLLPCPDVSLATHVPMSEQKKRRRGYDQAELIARRLARLAGVPYMADVLVRKRDTAVMSGLGAQGRRANMSGAFAVSAYARSLISGGELPVENVLLIDDVFTTGSSADACAAELKEAGAQTVTLFTFASGADWS